MLEKSSRLRIVLVQENENDRLLFRRAFQKSDVSCEIIEFSRAEEALEQLGVDAQSFDVVAVDHNLPGISGMDLCRKLLDKKIPPPLVLLAEMGSEQLVAEALTAGVHDYIIKDQEQGYLDLLPISLINIARRHVDHYSYKQAEKTRQDSEKAAGAFLDAIPDTAVLIDTEGNILVMNKAGADRMGKSIDEIIGRNVRELFPEDVYELRQSKVMEVIRTGNMVSYEDERDGICFDTCMCPVFDAQGKVERLAIFARDITARKHLENELAMHAAFPDQNPNPVLRISRDGLILNANRASEPVLRTWGIELGQCVPQASRKRVQETLSKDEVSSWEFTCHDGRIFLFTLAPVHDNGYLNLYGMDVTEHQKAQEVFRKSEEKFRLAMETTNDALWDWNIVTNEVYRNPRHATMLGYEPHEMAASQEEWEKLIHPDDRQAVFQISEEHLTGKRDSFEIEYRLRTKSGDYVWVLGRGKIVAYNNDGSPARMIGTNIDITERKKLHERDEIILKTSIDGFWLADSQGRILEVNDAYCRMSGYSRDELLTMSVQDVEAVEAPQETLQHIQRIMDKGFHRFQSSHRRKNGTIMDLDISVNYLELDGGRTFAFFRDITEQRNMEKALAENEEKYRTLVECARDSIFTLDERGVFLFVNKVWAETLGYQPEDLAGKTLWDVFPKKLAERQAANVRKVIETGQGINSISLTEIQNKPRWYSATIEPLKDDHGRVTTAMIIARDIDDMKRAEEQIHKLSSAVESSINGIAIGDAEGNLTYVNHAFLEMWGYDHENEVLGRNVIELWEMRDEAENVLNTLRDRNGWIGELAARKKDGSGMNVQACATLVTDENGKPISMMGSFVDISETKRKEEELNKYRGQMARAEQLASLGTLSATVAHQLTQPLTVIRLSMDNALDELEATSSSETVIRRLKDSVTQVSNITSIIGNFRNFARKSSGKTVAEVNLKMVAVRIARLLSESARSANIELRVRDMSELPCPWMNETDLEQLFFALIENSIQAADGKKTRQLVISGALKDKGIELRLSDDCGGIAPENLDKIFEPFFTTKPRGQGTGLGLCIVQDAISRMSGHVRVESDFGEGTTFIINLPIEKDKIS